MRSCATANEWVNFFPTSFSSHWLSMIKGQQATAWHWWQLLQSFSSARIIRYEILSMNIGEIWNQDKIGRTCNKSNRHFLQYRTILSQDFLFWIFCRRIRYMLDRGSRSPYSIKVIYSFCCHSYFSFKSAAAGCCSVSRYFTNVIEETIIFLTCGS